jgi:hypothetical protein
MALREIKYESSSADFADNADYFNPKRKAQFLKSHFPLSGVVRVPAPAGIIYANQH